MSLAEHVLCHHGAALRDAGPCRAGGEPGPGGGALQLPGDGRWAAGADGSNPWAPPSAQGLKPAGVSVVPDIRELIEVDDVMEDESLRFGPNGGLVFCMEYFANNFNWLEESLGHVEDDYILFDCPGK